MFRNKTLIQSASATSRAFSPLITTRRGPLTSAAFSAAQEWRRNYGSTDSNHHHHHKSSSSGPTQSSRRRAVWVFGAIVAALDIYWLSTNNNKSSTRKKEIQIWIYYIKTSYSQPLQQKMDRIKMKKLSINVIISLLLQLQKSNRPFPFLLPKKKKHQQSRLLVRLVWIHFPRIQPSSLSLVVNFEWETFF